MRRSDCSRFIPNLPCFACITQEGRLLQAPFPLLLNERGRLKGKRKEGATVFSYFVLPQAATFFSCGSSFCEVTPLPQPQSLPPVLAF